MSDDFKNIPPDLVGKSFKAVVNFLDQPEIPKVEGCPEGGTTPEGLNEFGLTEEEFTLLAELAADYEERYMDDERISLEDFLSESQELDPRMQGKPLDDHVLSLLKRSIASFVALSVHQEVQSLEQWERDLNNE